MYSLLGGGGILQGKPPQAWAGAGGSNVFYLPLNTVPDLSIVSLFIILAFVVASIGLYCVIEIEYFLHF